jgi:hypothetical protein
MCGGLRSPPPSKSPPSLSTSQKSLALAAPLPHPHRERVLTAMSTPPWEPIHFFALGQLWDAALYVVPDSVHFLPSNFPLHSWTLSGLVRRLLHVLQVVSAYLVLVHMMEG